LDFPGIVLDTSVFSGQKKPDSETVYDMLILGGGPAAMSAIVYAARKMLSLAVITLDFGGLMRETTGIENYLGFQSINASDLVARFEDHVRSFDIAVSLGIAVKEVKKNNGIFAVHMEDGILFSGKTVLFCLGERHRLLSVPGENEFYGKGLSYCATCDAPLFKGKKVMIVGGGNSAFTTAFDLMRVDARIVLVNFVEGWQAEKTLRQRVGKYDRMEFLDYHEVVGIGGKGRVEEAVVRNRKTGEEKRMPVDGVFVEIGLLPNSDPVKNLVKLNDQGEVVIDCACRTNMPGLFSAGDVTHVPHKQIIISAGEGAKAALTAYKYLIETGQI
jgi:NADH-dependent peroxiredoxin subunit F